MEYYELRKLYLQKKHNPFVPKHPFRLLIAGTSESGKTSMVVNLLVGSKYPKIYPWMSGEKHGHRIPKGGSKNFADYDFIMQRENERPRGKGIRGIKHKYNTSMKCIYQIWRSEEANRIAWNQIDISNAKSSPEVPIETTPFVRVLRETCYFLSTCLTTEEK
ncbi:15502_t:CDS:2 [Acaulospora morrowiae]|uniref:15502_t:CDS:1 n=1 Tax=Acaulospora morrowiae TaxID=94023 RepID=A0A9N9GDP0_9GLOM|nr:15502_t:CDS:2 [Acaulospora morrowiae]